jgi:hypothetical protein
MRVLKSVVIGMAVLIVLGMAMLVYGLTKPGWKPFANLGSSAPVDPNPAPAPATPAPTPFGDVRLPVPPGCSIADMAVAGQRLFVRVGPEGACARIVVLDAGNGAVLGTIGGP